MSLVEKEYRKFGQRTDKTKIIDGKIYHRIVRSDFLNISEKGALVVVPSPDMPKRAGAVYKDENGNHFTLKGMNHIRFMGEIPEWYFKCGECSMEWQETKGIGKYLTIIE